MLQYFINVITILVTPCTFPTLSCRSGRAQSTGLLPSYLHSTCPQWARNELNEEKLPLVAVLAAGIFALQSFNLPVSMGTSGHLVGGALAAIILGSPFAAVFILTLVLIVQGVVFGDGGITTMGANIINMGVIGGFVGFYTFKGLMRMTKSMPVSAFIAAWLACVIPALACAVEMFFAGILPLERRSCRHGYLPCRYWCYRRFCYHRSDLL